VTHSSIEGFANLLRIRNNGPIPQDELSLKDTRQTFGGKDVIKVSNMFDAYQAEMSAEQNANTVTRTPI
jgi:hypothetical protein